MKTKHTKGEWKVTEKAVAPNKVIVHANPKRIALCYNSATKYPSLYPSLEEAEANAKLIAAAPTLLDALIGARELLSKITSQSPSIVAFSEEENNKFRAIRIAIDKATL